MRIKLNKGKTVQKASGGTLSFALGYYNVDGSSLLQSQAEAWIKEGCAEEVDKDSKPIKVSEEEILPYGTSKIALPALVPNAEEDNDDA